MLTNTRLVIRNYATATKTTTSTTQSANNCTAEYTVRLLTTVTTQYTLYRITESLCLSVVEHSLSSMSSSQATCLYDSFQMPFEGSPDAEKIKFQVVMRRFTLEPSVI